MVFTKASEVVAELVAFRGEAVAALRQLAQSVHSFIRQHLVGLDIGLE